MARATLAFVALLLLATLVAASCPPKTPKPKKPPTVTPTFPPPVFVNPPVVNPPTPPPRTFPPMYPYYGPKCPVDTLKLATCANLLGGLVSAIVGTPPTAPCCSLIGGLADLEAAACLCTAIKANILGINLNVPVSLSLLVNACGKRLPAGFQCP